jgi:hypothetical protein
VAPDATVEIEVRDRAIPATVTTLPFVKRGRS